MSSHDLEEKYGEKCCPKFLHKSNATGYLEFHNPLIQFLASVLVTSHLFSDKFVTMQIFPQTAS